MTRNIFMRASSSYAIALFSAILTVTPVCADTSDNALVLEYRIGDSAPQILNNLSKAPLSAWLNILQQSATAAKQQQSEVISELNLRSSGGDLHALLQEFPALRLHTSYTDADKGQTLIKQAPFSYRMNEKNDSGTLEWQGIDGVLNFSADLVAAALNLNMPGLSLHIDSNTGDKVALNFSQLLAALSLDADNEPQHARVQLEKFMLLADDGTLKLEKLAAEMNIQEHIPALKLADTQLNIGHFSFTDQQITELAADDVQFSTKATFNQPGQYFSYDFNIIAERLHLPRTLSESDNINYRSSLVLNKIDAAAVAQIQKTLRLLRQQKMPPEMIGISIMGKFLEVLPVLLAQSPQLELREFKLYTDKGTLEASASLSIDGSKPLDFNDSAAITQVLQGHANLRASRNVIVDILAAQFKSQSDSNDTEEQHAFVTHELERLEKEGMLVADGEHYTLNALFKQGILLINGKEHALGQ
jgi:hypothetical protein